MGAEKKNIWDQGDGFNGGFNTPRENQQLLDGLDGRSDGSIYGEVGAQARRVYRPEPMVSHRKTGGSNVWLFLTAVVVLAMIASGEESKTRDSARKDVVTSHAPVLQPPTASTEIVLASMTQVNRFVVQQPVLRAGQMLQIYTDWEPSAAESAANLAAFAITRDAYQRRTPLGRITNIPAGPSVLNFLLPVDLAPGKYEVEVVWSFGSPPIESRDNFQVLR